MSKTYKTVKSQRAAEFKRTQYAIGLCSWCLNPRDDRRILCAICRKRQSDSLKKRTRNRVDNGQCRRCGKPIANHSTQLCLAHWYEKIARDRTGTEKNGNVIEQLFESQKHRCVYTGKELLLGKNAQLDHKVPIKLGGTNDPDNLQWVDEEINLMKGNRTHSDFIDLCKLIAAKF